MELSRGEKIYVLRSQLMGLPGIKIAKIFILKIFDFLVEILLIAKAI